MGQEITTSQFSPADFVHFTDRLTQETKELKRWFEEQRFSRRAAVAGYEMEAWLIDSMAQPSAMNQSFLEVAKNPLYTAELAQFNIELNTDPMCIQGDFLSQFEQQFQQHWQYCKTIAESIGCRVLSIGILPTLKDEDLSMENISPLIRYQALNEQVLLQRNGRPLELNIVGHQALRSTHYNVMLEAAATSLQIHLQSPQDMAHLYYNASLLISAPIVALSANSPYMFGKDLWSETRIPVFEQSVDIGGYNGAAQGPVHRVSFGTGFAKASLMECFEENLQHFPVLLPMGFSGEVSQMRHLSLHNGTIWRWNRPLIGFDEDATPHLRIEHRVVPSGPSVVDNIANMAFYFGLVHYYANQSDYLPELIEFSQVRDNFYTSAQHGLSNKMKWPGAEHVELRQLILQRLLNEAEEGLQSLKLQSRDIEFYLGVIRSRVESQQTGSQWQRKFIQKHGVNMQRLVETYYHNQQSGEPVHCWDFVSYV